MNCSTTDVAVSDKLWASEYKNVRLVNSSLQSDSQNLDTDRHERVNVALIHHAPDCKRATPRPAVELGLFTDYRI